jgi:hypothetical protein
MGGKKEADGAKGSWWKKWNNRYRLTVTDDESMEEVTSFQITRKNLYVAVSSLIVILVVFTGLLLSLTPLRYYIPGYGSREDRKAYIRMNMKMDSLENLVRDQDRYLNSIRAVLHGETPKLDTTLLRSSETETLSE